MVVEIWVGDLCYELLWEVFLCGREGFCEWDVEVYGAWCGLCCFFVCVGEGLSEVLKLCDVGLWVCELVVPAWVRAVEVGLVDGLSCAASL